ncbi:MAG: 4a-hydroxytetrahydrobiopterin dehydratase [Vicinamibacteria bacterium]|nr:4a-hydroxytetrahydrobiopterin dehydratase [Vicinamibacteria bacterium]
MKALSGAEIRKRLPELPGWTLSRGALRRGFKFETFPKALRFVARVGAMAEEADHHPDIDIRYRVVKLALRTHDVSGITEKDMALAAAIDRKGVMRKSV